MKTAEDWFYLPVPRDFQSRKLFSRSEILAIQIDALKAAQGLASAHDFEAADAIYDLIVRLEAMAPTQ